MFSTPVADTDRRDKKQLQVTERGIKINLEMKKIKEMMDE